MNWLRNFMIGRYGMDPLNFALVILSFLLSLFLRFVPVPFILLVAYIPLGLAVFRTFSRNIYKRQQENMKFLRWWNPLALWFKRRTERARDSKFHRYYKCPKCRQVLRVPKGRGKIRITCSKCRHTFIKKT